MIISPDRIVAVGPGANDFVTEIFVKVSQHDKHDIKKWKDVPDLEKDRITVHILVISLCSLKLIIYRSLNR